MNQKQTLRAALYVRVSTEEQAMHGYSLQAQRASLTAYARKNGMKVVDVYADEGITARKKYTKRTEFMRMLADVQTDKIDVILFIKLDRWFRSISDYYKIQEILERNHVEWKTTEENYDTSTANGRLHINIRLSVAQDESDRTSERIRFVFGDKIRRGEVIGHKFPRGYSKGAEKSLVHNDDAPIIQDLFNYYENNRTVRGTMNYIRTRYGITYTPAGMKMLLMNRMYTGEYHDNPTYCEPIIIKEQFDRVQELLEKRSVRRTPSGRIYLFSGLLVCGSCGRNMVCQTTLGKYQYYLCPAHYNHQGCDHKKMIHEKRLEKYLLDYLYDDVLRMQSECEIVSTAPRPAADRQKIRDKMAKLKDLYLDDLIDREEYRRDYEAYKSQLTELEEKTVKVDYSRMIDFLQGDFKSLYPTLTPEEKKILWNGIIDHINFDMENNPTIFVAKNF